MTKTPRRAGRLGRALVAAALLATAACSSDDGAGRASSTTTAAPGRSGSVTSEDEPMPTNEEPTVDRIDITIEDPKLGRLSFPAIAAGDPALAAEGRLVLFLHGFPETSASYREIIPKVAAAGYYAVAPDQRGYSPDARPEAIEDYFVTNMAADTLAMASALRADTFHLVGHDWGGGVAWTVAAVDPTRVASLTALSTPHPDAFGDQLADPSGEQAEKFGYQDWFAAPGSEDGMLADGRATFVELFTAGGIPPDHAEAYADVLATKPALRAALNWYRANPLPTDLRMGPVSVPTTFVFGEDDIAFTQQSADATEKYVDAPYTYRSVAGLGHWIPEEAPDLVAAAVIARADAVQ